MSMQHDPVIDLLSVRKHIAESGLKADELDALYDEVQSLETFGARVFAADMIAASLCNARDYEGSVRFFEMVSNLCPSSAQKQANFGIVLHRVKRSEEAVAYLRRACRLDEQNPLFNLSCANTYFEMGDTEKSLKYYDRAFRFGVDERFDNASVKARAHDRYALCLREAGDFPKGLKHARLVVSYQPDDFDYQTNLGLALNDAEDFSEAKDCLEAAVGLTDVYKDKMRASLGLAVALNALGQHEDAESEIGFVIGELGQGNPGHLCIHAEALQGQGRLTEAYRVVNDVITLSEISFDDDVLEKAQEMRSGIVQTHADNIRQQINVPNGPD